LSKETVFGIGTERTRFAEEVADLEDLVFLGDGDWEVIEDQLHLVRKPRVTPIIMLRM
jgi:hypothetical protein